MYQYQLFAVHEVEVGMKELGIHLGCKLSVL